MSQRLLEICVDSLDLALAAVRGGADRLELCGPLFDGGVTPSPGFVAAARRMIELPLAMLVRPRPGSCRCIAPKNPVDGRSASIS
jgi:copper homeostasis protein